MRKADFAAAAAAAQAYRRGVSVPDRAEHVALESLRRCRDSVATLCERLVAAGYSSVPGIQPRASERAVGRVRELAGGPVPRVVELFWAEVGGIRIADIVGYSHIQFLSPFLVGTNGSPRVSDALFVDALSDGWLEMFAGECADYREGDDLVERESLLVPLSPDCFHKDNMSGGAPCGIEVGDDNWMPRFSGGFAWCGPRKPTLVGAAPHFMDYLRAAVLEAGGFPGLLGVESFDRLRDELTDGLPVF